MYSINCYWFRFTVISKSLRYLTAAGSSSWYEYQEQYPSNIRLWLSQRSINGFPRWHWTDDCQCTFSEITNVFDDASDFSSINVWVLHIFMMIYVGDFTVYSFSTDCSYMSKSKEHTRSSLFPEQQQYCLFCLVLMSTTGSQKDIFHACTRHSCKSTMWVVPLVRVRHHKWWDGQEVVRNPLERWMGLGWPWLNLAISGRIGLLVVSGGLSLFSRDLHHGNLTVRAGWMTCRRFFVLIAPRRPRQIAVIGNVKYG